MADTNTEKIEQLSQDMKVVMATMTELKIGLIGSEKIGVEGVVQKVKKNSEYIETDKKQKYKIVGAGMVIIFILGMLKDFIIELFKKG